MRLLIAGLLAALAVGPALADETTLAGRSAIIEAPAAPTGLVVVLHGGGGSGAQIRRGLTDFESRAEAAGLVVAYLDGSPAFRDGGARLAWNAGGCCGLPMRQGVDDAGYVAGAVDELQKRYGLKSAQTFALGLSNGAMMAQAMLCHNGVFARIVAIAGPLQDGDSQCPEARGRAVLAIHGDADTNVPMNGGMGSGIARVEFNSEAATEARLTAAGATYRLLIVKGAAHRLRTVEDAMAAEGTSLGGTAVAFLTGQELP